MNTYSASTAVSVDFAVNAGVGLRWRVLDDALNVLQEWVVLSTPVATQTLSLTVPAAVNALAAPATRGLRSVELQTTSANGTQVQSVEYMIQGESQLIYGLTSFQTYYQAMMISTEIVGLNIVGWNDAERPAREAAMLDAYERLLRTPIQVRREIRQILWDDALVPVLDIGSPVFLNLRYNPYLSDMTQTDMEKLDPKLVMALRRAQVLEASDLLNPDSLRQARKDGLQSLTVGESSQTWRSSKPVSSAICPAATEVLGAWMGRFRAVIGRG
jgi:hypothetical protein